MNSYQKLKKQNEQLQRDISDILGYNGFHNKSIAETKHRMKRDLERVVFFGNNTDESFSVRIIDTDAKNEP